MVKRKGLRPLLTYLIAMTAIVGISASAVYIFFVRSLDMQLNSRLITLAQAAAPSLSTIRTNGEDLEEREITWRRMFSNNRQSLTWFDRQGNQLAHHGKFQIESPIKEGIVTTKEDQMRFYTTPVYILPSGQSQPKLEGYIRASESTREIDSTITSLRLWFWLGGVAFICFSGLSSLWLAKKLNSVSES